MIVFAGKKTQTIGSCGRGLDPFSRMCQQLPRWCHRAGALEMAWGSFFSKAAWSTTVQWFQDWIWCSDYFENLWRTWKMVFSLTLPTPKKRMNPAIIFMNKGSMDQDLPRSYFGRVRCFLLSSETWGRSKMERCHSLAATSRPLRALENRFLRLPVSCY